MAHEILSFKLIKPFLGSSIYVWTSVLTASLLGLAIGYMLGAKFSKKAAIKTIFGILSLAGILLIGLPYYSYLILESTINMEIKTGILLSAIVIISPIMLLLGMFSPIIVQVINVNNKNNGQSSGFIYSISTIGGIIFSMGCSFITIPTFGIKLSYLIVGSILVICSLGSLLFSKLALHEK